LRDRKPGDAQAAAVSAVRLAPDESFTHSTLGLVALTRGRAGEAERHLREALRLQPTNYTALNNLGVALEKRGRRRDAVAQYAYAAEERPNAKLARRNLFHSGQAYAVSGVDFVLIVGWMFTSLALAITSADGAAAPDVALGTLTAGSLAFAVWWAARRFALRSHAKKLPPSARAYLLDEHRRRAWQAWPLLLLMILPSLGTWIGRWATNPEANAPHGGYWLLLLLACAAAGTAAVRTSAGVRRSARDGSYARR
jgi:hypothetical protein